MKKIIAALLVLAALVSFSFILFSPPYDKEGVATATPTQLIEYLPTLVTQNTPASSISRDALQKYASADIETQTVNGTEMSASNFRIEDKFLKVNICFTNPNNQEWSLGEAAVQIGNDKVLPFGGSTLEVSRNLGDGLGEITTISDKNINLEKINYSVPNYRCDMLLFLVDAKQAGYSGTVALTVKNINMVPKGVCETTETIQRILNEKKLGIKIACAETGSDGLYGAQIKILEKPQNMSEEQAQQYISEARREVITIDGPWVFEGTVTIVQTP